MNHFIPADFDCSDLIRRNITQKLTAFEAIADELPVFIVHDVRDFSVVYLSSNGLKMLGATLEEVRQLGQGYFTKFFNSNDVAFYLPKFMELLKADKNTKWFSFFQQVATGEERGFEWYLSAARPFIYDEKGKPLLSLTFALQLDPNHHLAEKAERLMEENLLLKDNYQRYASLTTRERELLQYIASGETAVETSSRVFISEKTLHTHRRNIKRKLGAKSQYDIIKFAQAFNLV
ncbi:helix-turn-helix domain-containing protein [Parapedobacter indicus]|uniref:Regulatory protein, luxR family n=1 Tax=Parapedobacter indicus TaxID=1477437 RepID=A0A1I3IGH8_9SPHI|nr:helix-turn-helix transcriptional regulator [Parapedobacter indicus]PPL02161.1 regulatory LuxR family protein [Parapedobacter indicus]SFI47135.1 regulatory protein, luxR family [Parapedobacter indicus]